MSELRKKDNVIQNLKAELIKVNSKLTASQETCIELENKLEYVERKLKVYDAFFKDDPNAPPNLSNSIDPAKNIENSSNSDIAKINRLQQLNTLNASSYK